MGLILDAVGEERGVGSNEGEVLEVWMCVVAVVVAEGVAEGHAAGVVGIEEPEAIDCFGGKS